MTKRRDAGQNWYTLSLEERSRLMQAHGMMAAATQEKFSR
jgi:chlorite dismutase